MSPLRLLRVRADNYKAFEGRIELALAPVTLVFGRNGSGKSALVRLPGALAGALAGATTPGLPLQLHDDLVLGHSLASFVHGGSADTYAVGADMASAKGPEVQLDVTVRRDPRTSIRLPGQWIDRWALHADNAELGSFAWSPRDRRYEAQGPSEPERPASFAGLLPLLRDGSVHPLAARLRPAPRVIHLGATRGVPGEDFTAHQPGVGLDVGHVGANTRQVLGALRLHTRPEVLHAVVEAVRACFDVDLRVLEVSQGAVIGTVIEGKPCARDTWLPLRELGTGLQHALPLLVQYAVAAHGGEEHAVPSLITCEEPEAHTHPQVQAKLADAVIDAATKGGSWTLVETHSETFVLRVRRRVAEGTLSPDAVAMYWVDDETATTRVQRLHIDAHGHVADWPDGWFDAALHEVSAIRRAMGRPS